METRWRLVPEKGSSVALVHSAIECVSQLRAPCIVPVHVQAESGSERNGADSADVNRVTEKNLSVWIDPRHPVVGHSDHVDTFSVWQTLDLGKKLTQ